MNVHFLFFMISTISARRSIDELNALLNDANDAEILNLPLRSLDQEKLQNSPFLQFIASRKQSV